MEYTAELYPALRGASLAEKVNGMFSFTPDGHSLIGESLAVRRFWACEAVGITPGPGAPRAVGAWCRCGVRRPRPPRAHPHPHAGPTRLSPGLEP